MPPRRLLPLLAALCAVAPIAVGRAAEPPAIDRVLRVSIGADRSVATVATLAGPAPGEAVLWRRGDAVSVVARTGEPTVTVDGGGFELRAIGRAWAAPGALLYLGTTVEGPPVLVHHGPSGARLLAIGADPAGALAAAGRPTIDATGCSVELEVFGLLGTDAAPLAADGSVRFPAWLGAPCAEARASVRYRAGRYAVESLTVAPSAPSTETPGPWRDAVPDRIDVADGLASGAARP